jgi:HAAS domain-containing protein
VNTTAQDEIYEYVGAVRQALSGLTDEMRDELLEDLPEHLAEVLAEGSGTLVDRLGTPEAYAAELRATAGLVGGFPDPPPPRFRQLADTRDTILRLLRRADVRIGPVIGYPKASDFLVLLRPAWWVLRGYLAAMAIAFLLDTNRSGMGLLPRVGDNGLVALFLLAGCIIASIVLGGRSRGLARGPRYALRAGTAFLIIFALAGFEGADSNARNIQYSDANYGTYYDNNPYSHISDVFVYDGTGKLVNGAHLFDQDGNPIEFNADICLDQAQYDASVARGGGYPYCPENAPFGSSRPQEPQASSAPAEPSSVAPSPSRS